QHARQGRAGPPPAARRLPARRAQGRLRRPRAHRAGRGVAGPGRRVAEEPQGAGAGPPRRRPGPGVGRPARPGDRRGHVRRPVLRHPQRPVRPLPGPLQLPRPRRGEAAVTGRAGRPGPAPGGRVLPRRRGRPAGSSAGAGPAARRTGSGRRGAYGAKEEQVTDRAAWGAGDGARPRRVLTPAEIARMLGRPEPTPEQARVIAAPLGPSVVVAGAGSGKSETMAGRVVWLVANGFVRPEQVLGLTFTRKAVAELAERVRTRLDQLRGTEQVPAEVLDGEPDVSTYNSYAARLVGDHALREAIEPGTRLLSQGQSWQLAAHLVETYDGPMDAVDLGPQTVVERVLALAGDLSDHLRTPDDVRGVGRWIDDR